MDSHIYYLQKESIFRKVCKNTLKIKNLPKELTDAQKEEFIRFFGALKVKVVTSSIKQKSTVFARFESDELAKNVLFRLHQAPVLNCRLCVEFAENDILQGKQPLMKLGERDITTKRCFKTFIKKITSLNESVGFHQPPPSHLKYLYPKANRATINNIAHALATIPRFYTQVLHLMNRMNLPPPFAVEPQISITPSLHPISVTKSLENPSPLSEVDHKPFLEDNKQSNSESELESDENDDTQIKEILPLKRKRSNKTVVKRPKFIKPRLHQISTGKPPEKHENVFEKVNVHVQKKIEVKIDPEALELSKTAGAMRETEKPDSFDMLLPLINPDPPKCYFSAADVKYKQAKQNEKIITTEELLNNQIQPKDFNVLQVFKNYHPGVPTSRLYIKNCSKSVEIGDLEYIYHRYKVKKEGANSPSQFDIRLMQEGRMKGQAFVTLDTVELAQKALAETNGFILKDKPLVVVFARSAAHNK